MNNSGLLLIFHQLPIEEQTNIIEHYISQGYKNVDKTIGQVLVEHPDLMIFSSILEEHNMLEFLDKGVYTVFAPKNVSSMSLESLKNHIVENTYPRHYLEKLKHHNLCMINNQYIQFWGHGNGVCIRDNHETSNQGGMIRFVGEQIFTKNGIIHIIEKDII